MFTENVCFCLFIFLINFFLHSASSSVTGAVGMTTSGESESDDSEMGRLQGISRDGPLLLSVSQIKLFTFLAILDDGLRN